MICSELREKIFSDNTKFSHLNRLPSDHWMNSNRRHWSKEEQDVLYREHAGYYEITLNSCDVLLSPVDLNYKARVIEDLSKDYTPIICGRVIKLGTMAFDTICFPAGATCTLGDYVLFNYEDSIDWKLDFHSLVTINDLDILGTIKNPYEIKINNK